MFLLQLFTIKRCSEILFRDHTRVKLRSSRKKSARLKLARSTFQLFRDFFVEFGFGIRKCVRNVKKALPEPLTLNYLIIAAVGKKRHILIATLSNISAEPQQLELDTY